MKRDALMNHEMAIPKIICTEFYDGAVSGFCEIIDDNKSETYRFELVSWDKGQDTRVFGLSPMSPDSFETIVNLLAGPPTWPFLGPQVSAEGVNQQIATLKDHSKKFVRLILTDSYMKELRGMVAMGDEIRSKLPVRLPCYESSSFSFWRDLFKKS